MVETIVNPVTRRPPYQQFSNVPIGNCRWTKGFWADKLKVCTEAMVPYMEEVLCGDVGHALNNFKIAAGEKSGTHKGMFWHDGDFYKWLEAAIYVYSLNGDTDLLQRINEHVALIGRAQEPDGYLQTQVQLRPEVDRYENRKYHEMYNTGHLLITACVHFRVTGARNFLDIAIKHADLLYTIFYPETKQYGRFGFNQTQIMGLVELYRVTEDKRYLNLAERFIRRRGTFPVVHHPTTEGYPIGDMVQERTPLLEADEAVGHAVLALYYYAGAADVYAETGEAEMLAALDRLWTSVTQKKMYVTGAVGQTHYGASSNRDKVEEGFIDDYMMPNMTAYNETCANLCNAMFSYRMLGLKGEAKYADIIEKVLLNSGLSGISVSGKEYFYANPLRMVANARSYNDHENATETPNREPYLECFCCPPNLVRTIAKSAGWAYSLTDNGVAVNLYGGNLLDTQLNDGSELRLRQETNYPWEGEVTITIEACKHEAFKIMLRIPEWAAGSKVEVNGEVQAGADAGAYLTIEKQWRSGDTIHLSLPMDTYLLQGHPRIEEVRNQVAVCRGPIVYCVESPDLPDGTSILDVYLQQEAPLVPEYRPDFLGGVTVLQTELLLSANQTTKMYDRVGGVDTWENVKAELVPYFSWSNRGQAEMTVFLPIIWAKA